jgi:FkbM family methyltransferase
MGILNYENDIVSGEKHFIQKTLSRLLNSMDRLTFLDVGANSGKYTLMLKKTFPESTIYAFEPHPVSYSKLMKNCAGIEGVTPLNLALGEDVEEKKLYDIDVNGSEHASFFQNSLPDGDIKNIDSFETKVMVGTLDEITQNYNIDCIDFLKIDTEGAELDILKGGIKLLNEKKIKIIQLEFNMTNVVSRVFFRDIRLHLKEYTFFRLLPKSLLLFQWWSPYCEIFAFQNIICIHNTMMEKYNRLTFNQ